MKNISNQIHRLRQMQQSNQIDNMVNTFAAENKGKDADKISHELSGLLESTMESYSKRETELEKLFTEANSTLSGSRKALAAEQTKISDLKAKLRNLSKNESYEDMFRLIIAFSKEVDAKLDELKDAESLDSGK